MLRPSYAELMDILSENSKEGVTSRYTVVIAAAKRARQIIDGDEPMVDADVNEEKPVSIAVEEMREGKISIVPEGQGTMLKPKSKTVEEEIRRELENKAEEEEADDGEAASEDIADYAEEVREDMAGSAEEDTEDTADDAGEKADVEADEAIGENATEE